MDAEPTGPDFLGESSFSGNVARIRFLLSVGVSPDAADRAGFRALHRCAVSGNVGAAEALLSAGATVDLTDAFGDTALHYASFCGHADMVAVLLDAGADAARASSDGRTPLAAALEERHDAVARLLIDALPAAAAAAAAASEEGGGAAEEEEALPESVQARGGAPARRAPGSSTSSPPAASPASAAAGAASHPLRGAAAARRRSAGAGAASSAAAASGKAVTGLSASAQARGVALLRDAVQAGDLRRAYELLQGDADVNGVDSDGFTALHRAVVTGNVPACDLLLGHGADPSARDSSGSTPLHYAAALGLTEVVHVLLAAGSDPARRDREGVTAVELADSLGHAATSRLLSGGPARVEGLDLSFGVILEGELRAKRGGHAAFFAWKSKYAVLCRAPHRALFLWTGTAAAVEGGVTRVPLEQIDAVLHDKPSSRRFAVRPRDGDLLELAAATGEEAALWVASLRSVMVACHEADSAEALLRALAAAQSGQVQSAGQSVSASSAAVKSMRPATSAGAFPVSTATSAATSLPGASGSTRPAGPARYPGSPPKPAVSASVVPPLAPLPGQLATSAPRPRRTIAGASSSVASAAANDPQTAGSADTAEHKQQQSESSGSSHAVQSQRVKAATALQRIARGFLARRLVAGWERIVDPEDGDIYWYHERRKLSSWFPPGETAPPQTVQPPLEPPPVEAQAK